jgi:hypothetical protein
VTVHVYEYCGRWVARCSAGGIAYGTSEFDAFWKLMAKLCER